jgi:fluoroquinolone transport system permease protein
MKKLIRIAVNDFRLIFRDNSLKIFIALPVLNLLVIRYVAPYVASVYEAVQDYLALILMLATMQGSIAFGFIYSMVFVDEKDTSVAKVYGIVPVSKFWFIVFRLIPPFLLATLSTFFLLLAEPFYGLPLVSNIVYSTLAGLVAPTMTLFVATLATNKIEAMTWQKLFNLPLMLPIASFFVPTPFSVLFAIFPTYWAYQGFSSLIDGGNFWLYMLIGTAYSLALVALMINKFTSHHFK